MLKTFTEIAYLSDRDIATLLQAVENWVLITALSQEYKPYCCDPFVRERILAQFSYIGWKSYEMDRYCFRPEMPGDIVICQMNIVEIANQMIQERQFQDYHLSWRA